MEDSPREKKIIPRLNLQNTRGSPNSSVGLYYSSEDEDIGEEPYFTDVGEWLKSFGMEKYLPVFKHEEIDMTIMHYIDNDKLLNMGVKTLGARLRILASIKKLPSYRRMHRSVTPTNVNASNDILLTNIREMKYLGKNLEKLSSALPSFFNSLSQLKEMISD